MNGKKLFATILFIIAIALGGWWFAEGHHPWTSSQRMVEVKQVDEIFGTTTTTQKWEQHFAPGLEIVGPAFAVLAGVGVWLLISAKKKTA